MKLYKLLTVLVLIPALFLAGCGTTTFSLSAMPKLAALQATATPVADLPASPSNIIAVDAPKTTSASSAALAALQGTFEDIYTQVNPSVVNIQVEIGPSSSNSNSGRLPFGSQGVQEALGSGFVWDTAGHIVTNNHVVGDASKITVTFSDGSTVDAKLVGADPNSDLAVIQVDVAADKLRPVVLTDSAQVKVGQLAIAIGNPYGLSGTMTEGIISALSRSLPVDSTSNGQSGGTYSIPDIIQTDAAINPGNSGGVLVDVQGQVIGVTAAIQSPSNANAGIGFVIPANIVKRVVPSLIQTGQFDHPWIGISGVDLTSNLNSALNLNAGQKGVLVVDVAANSPAEKAGLQGSSIQSTANGQQIPTGGDVITALDGHKVSTTDDLTSYLYSNAQVGQAVTLTILRDGKEQALKLTLGVLAN